MFSSNFKHKLENSRGEGKSVFIYNFVSFVYLYFCLLAFIVIYLMLCVNADHDHLADIEGHPKRGRNSYVNNYARRNLKENAIQIYQLFFYVEKVVGILT